MSKRKAGEQTEWVGLMRPADIPAFALWLEDKRHGWMLQSPDAGECLRAWRDGCLLIIRYDGKRTRCTRHGMAFWWTYVGLKE